MAKLTLSDLGDLTNETSAVTTINQNSAAIETAMENTLSRDGTSPNQMNATLDMNSNRIINLPRPLTATEAARKAEIDALAGLISSGGTGDGSRTTIYVTDFGAANDGSSSEDTLERNEAAINTAVANARVSGLSVTIEPGVVYRRDYLDWNRDVLIHDLSRNVPVDNQNFWWAPTIGRGQMVAHHNCQGIMPENTMAGITSLALIPWLTGQEIDGWVCQDGSLPMLHDSTWLRTTGQAGNVVDGVQAVWKTYNAAYRAPPTFPAYPQDIVDYYPNGWYGNYHYWNNARIPTFQEAIKPVIAGGQTFWYDLKGYYNEGTGDYSYLDYVLEAIEQYHPNLILTMPGAGLKIDSFRYIRSKNKSIPLCAGFAGTDTEEDIREFARLGGELYLLAEWTTDFLDDHELLDIARAEGIQIVADGIDRQWKITQARSIGIDCYMVDALSILQDNFALPEPGGAGPGPDHLVPIVDGKSPKDVWAKWVYENGVNSDPVIDEDTGILTLAATAGNGCLKSLQVKGTGGQAFRLIVDAYAEAGSGRIYATLDQPYGPVYWPSGNVVTSSHFNLGNGARVGVDSETGTREWRTYTIPIYIPPHRENAKVFFTLTVNGQDDTIHFRNPRIEQVQGDWGWETDKLAYGLLEPEVVKILQSFRTLDGEQPAPKHIRAYQDLIIRGKTFGWWQKLDRLYAFGALDQNAALLDLVSGTKVTRGVGGLEHTPLSQIQGDGTSGSVWLVGDFANLSEFAEDDCHIGAYVTENSSDTNAYVFGCANIRLCPRNSDGNIVSRLNTGTSDTFATASALGHYVLNRSLEASYDVWKDGSNLTTHNRTSDAPSGPMYLFLLSSTYSSHGVSFFHIGSALSADDIADMKSAFDEFTAAMSAATKQSQKFADNIFRLQDNSDPTKQLAFELSGITTATTRTVTVPDANTTLVGTDVSQTLSNKTLQAATLSGDRLVKGVYILGAGTGGSVTGTTSETILATVTVPANAMGANGRIEIDYVMTYTNSANNKINNVRWGGIAGTAITNNTRTTTATESGRLFIQNKNATNSQTSWVVNNVAGVGTSSGSVVTASRDTTAAQDIVFTGTLVNTGETITLDSYCVKLIVP